MRWFLSKAPADPVQPSEEPKPSVLAKLPTNISHSDPSEALKHFERPGVPPPSSRAGDPTLKQGEREPMRLWHWWKFGAFAAVKGKPCQRIFHPRRNGIRFLPKSPSPLPPIEQRCPRTFDDSCECGVTILDWLVSIQSSIHDVDLLVYCLARQCCSHCFMHILATTLAADALSHHLWGPPRKSWGIEMTLLSSMMRGVSRYSHLTDIVRNPPLHPIAASLRVAGHYSDAHEHRRVGSRTVRRPRNAGHVLR